VTHHGTARGTTRCPTSLVSPKPTPCASSRRPGSR
jgi:hypothetical protein